MKGRPFRSALFFNPSINKMDPLAEYYNDLQQPSTLASMMVHNNLDGLNQRAIQFGHIQSPLGREEMFSLIKRFSASGDYQTLQQLFSVDYVPNVFPRSNDVFFFNQFSPTYRNNLDGPPTEEEWWNGYNDTGNGSWWSDMDWGGIVDSLGGVITIFSGWGDEPTDTPAPAPAPVPGYQPPSKGLELNLQNALLIGGFVTLLVLLVRKQG